MCVCVSSLSNQLTRGQAAEAVPTETSTPAAKEGMVGNMEYAGGRWHTSCRNRRGLLHVLRVLEIFQLDAPFFESNFH